MSTQTQQNVQFGGPPRKPKRRWPRAFVVFRYWRWVVFPAIAAAVLAGVLYGARELGERVGVAIQPEDEVQPGQPVAVEIPAGAGAGQIATILSEAGVVDSAGDFEREVLVQGASQSLKAGVYLLQTGMDAADAVAAVVSGPGANAVYTVRIREGATVDGILTLLAADTPFTVEELSTPLLNGAVSSSLLPEPADELTDWEGLLFPDTYELFAEDGPAQILARPAAIMESRVESVDWSGLDDLGVSRYEAIIIASLIETEAGIDEDRPLIASVIYNRLRDGIELQIDATVQYALPERKPRLTFNDLEIDSPYNTYRIPGLPPTPIATPSLASLEAAAAPAETGFYFYVLANEEGGHAFAETAAQFEELVAQARRDGILPP